MIHKMLKITKLPAFILRPNDLVRLMFGLPLFFYNFLN